MPYCTVKWCGKNSATSSYAKDGITFHRYPTNPDTKELWIAATQKENFWPTHNSVICSRHFTPDCFVSMKGNRRRIFNTAIPTQYLPILTSPKDTTEQTPVPCTITSNVPEQPSQNLVLMPNDMANYTQYIVMGTVSRVRMKPECIPTKFHCQEDREKLTCTTVERPYKKRKTIVECENDLEECAVTECIEPKETSCGSGVKNSSVALTVLPPKVYPKMPLDTLKGQKGACSTIQNKNARKPDLIYLLNQHKFLSKNSKTLTFMQLRGNTRIWKEEEKYFSISLYSFIPDSYGLLIDMGIVLPPEATVKKWLSEIPVMNSLPQEQHVEINDVSVKVEPADECGASVEEQHVEINDVSVKVEPADECGASVEEQHVEINDVSVKVEPADECDASVEEQHVEINDVSVKVEPADECGASVEEQHVEINDVSVKVEPADECGASVEEQHVEINDVSVKVEPADECGASVEEQHVEINDVSVKVEPADECDVTLEGQHEEMSGASVKQEPEDYSANVKQEDGGSAAYVYVEHEFTLDVGPEQLQPQDIALTPNKATGKSQSAVNSERGEET